jgi:hypothetical protein
MKLEFRELRADEIDCRVGMCRPNGCTLLLYKDARCDMNILDESVGAMNWQRKHTRDNANCIVSIWDDDKKQWIEKEDTGTESNTEAEKGLASDSFKRACFNWGIGRELYTAPFIWIPSDKYEKNDKNQPKVGFIVTEMTVKDRKIIYLSIANARTKEVVYTYGTKPEAKPEKAPVKKAPTKKTIAETAPTKSTADIPEMSKDEARQMLIDYCSANGVNIREVGHMCNLNKNSTADDFMDALALAQGMATGSINKEANA